MYVVRVFWPHLTNTEHGMKPLKAKERTNTSVSSDVMTTALYPAAAAWNAWSNIWHQLPLESTLALPLLLPQLKWLVSKTVFPARLSLRLSFCQSSDMNLIKSDLLFALDRNFRHWCILWSALMFLNLWLVSEPSFSVAVNIKDHVNTLTVCSFMQNHFHQAIGHFSKGLLVALYLVNHCHSVENYCARLQNYVCCS